MLGHMLILLMIECGKEDYLPGLAHTCNFGNFSKVIADCGSVGLKEITTLSTGFSSEFHSFVKSFSSPGCN